LTKEEAEIACAKLLKSFDGTKCSETCIYPDVFDKTNQKCLKACPENTIPDESASVITCVASKDCATKLSSDGKTCVKDCSLV